MLIGIDGNEANIKNRVGVGQYAYNLLLNLYKIDKKNQYIIYLKNRPLTDLPKQNSNWQYKVFGPKKLWTKIALPIKLYIQKEKLDIFYSPSHYSPQFAPCPTIPTIHDLGYLKFPNQFTKKDLYQLINWTKQSIKKATHIITVSNFSKTEIEKIYKVNPKKITVAYNGVGEVPKISKKDSSKILEKFNIKNPYFLYLGTLKPNKNIPFLIKSYSLFLKKQKGINLAIAGKKGWLFNEIFQTVKSEKLEKQIIFTDFISETEKWILYQNAICTILPSLYEGFGIPIIESMKTGTPVIASNITVLKEVIKDNGLYFNPNNQQELVDQMIKIKSLNSSEIKRIIDKAKIRADFFTWENTAKSVLEVFNKINNI